MSSSRSNLSDIAKGNEFLKKLLYVQHVDKEKDASSDISELSFQEYLLAELDIFSESDFSKYLTSPKQNLGILRSSLSDKITWVEVYSNPLPAMPALAITDVTIHAFVVFSTENKVNSKETWWSLEKNGQYIVLQQSPDKDDVTKKLYDADKNKHVKRLEPVDKRDSAFGSQNTLETLFRAIWENNQINDKYNLLFANCQNFANFIFQNATFYRQTWSTRFSAVFDFFRLKSKKTLSGIEAGKVKIIKYKSILNDDKWKYYKAMIEGRREDFKKLAIHLTAEHLNSKDSQGYTMLEWATVFSTSDWNINKMIEGIGAQIAVKVGLFHRNVLFIALEYLPLKKELENNFQFLRIDGIDINGKNKTNDTALHLALYGEKWETAEKILDKLGDDDVNATDSSGDTPLNLAAQLNCETRLFSRILARTNLETVNKQNNKGRNALHYVILNESNEALTEMLKRKDVDVNIKDIEKYTTLHYASMWKDIPIHLFKFILKKSIDINAKNKKGRSALHLAIISKSKTSVKELLSDKRVNVNIKDKAKNTTLHYASMWKDMPIHLFKIILNKSDDINAKSIKGHSALHMAIILKSETSVKELLSDERVNVNKDKAKNTTLHIASMWKDMPIHLFKIILNKSDDINAQNITGHSALHLAISYESKTSVNELLSDKRLNVNIKDKEDYTTLHIASMWKDMPIHLFKIILKKSDDINAKNKNGLTARDVAISESAVKELDKGVNVDLEEHEQNTIPHQDFLGAFVIIIISSYYYFKK